MSDPKQTPSSQDSPSLETTEKPTQSNNDNLDTFGLVALLKHMRQDETKISISQKERYALTAWGSKLVDEQQVKENRVKGKADSYKPRKKCVAKVYAELKLLNGKNPPLKVLMCELEKQYPEGPIKKDGLPKGWTEGGIKDWWSALNKGKTILDGS